MKNEYEKTIYETIKTIKTIYILYEKTSNPK